MQKQQKYIKKETLNFGRGRPHFIMIWNITIRYNFWRTSLFQDAYLQVLYPYYVENHMKAMLHWQMCGCIGKIWAQRIDYKTID